MTVKEIKAKYKWKKDYSPILLIDYCIVTAFTNQHIFTLSLFSDALWFEIHFSNYLTSFKIGIVDMYFIIGGGSNG
jgi:hypothetical protein|tara:strand:+ start:3165 stop:3392 length:228 start_codon:yes stop_codon:yes gene_type:complete